MFLVFIAASQLVDATTFYGVAGTALVVDASSGAPLADVIVEAVWEITNYRDPTGPPLAMLRQTSTQTDANGQFTFLAWGPVTINLHSNLRSVLKVLDRSQPHLYLYRLGYRAAVEKGPVDHPRSFWDTLHLSEEDLREAWWDQHTFKLEHSSARPEQRIEELSVAMAALKNCRWVRTPKIAAAYIREALELRTRNSLSDDPATAKLLDEDCPNAPRPLRAYLN
jgi:hypothetical protein